jgi:hypothetical protein
MSENKTDKTVFWSRLGEGVCIFLICLGYGTCSLLQNSKFDLKYPPNEKNTTNTTITK